MAANQVINRKKFRALAIVIICAALAAFAAFKYGLLSEIENYTWDARARYIAPQTPVDPRIRIIMIDQSSIDHFARDEKIFWPWPRSLYAAVISFLNSAGARAAAFDMLYTEPSIYGVEDDQAFAQATAGKTKIVIATALREAAPNTDLNKLELLRKRAALSFGSSSTDAFLKSIPHIRNFSSLNIPIDELLSSSVVVGNVTAEPDADGLFRRASPGGFGNGIPVLSLPFAQYAAAGLEPLSTSYIESAGGKNGRLAVRFAGGEGTYPTDSFAAIVESTALLEQGKSPIIDLSRYKDALVFIGPNAPGLLDLRPTPLSRVYSGVEFNATILDNLIHSNFIRKVTLRWDILASVLLAAIVAAATLFLNGVVRQVTAILAATAIFVAIAFYLASLGYWILMAAPLSIAALGGAASLAYEYQLEGRQYRYLRGAFHHYVSPAVIDRIVEDPTALALGGERRELTMFFSDIEGFTSISEKLEAGQLVKLLNIFLSEMASIILDAGGTLDKYVGDAIVAFWNAPVTLPDHAARATRAAIRCQERLTELRPEFEREFGFHLKMRIGLHTGTVNVGNFGSKERFNYTIIGDAANLASRLEGANKYFGTYILASEDTVKKLPGDIKRRKIAEVLVSGRVAPTAVYEPISSVEFAKRAAEIQIFAQGIACVEKNDLARALTVFAAIQADPVAKKYAQKIDSQMRASDGNAGSRTLWNLTEK